MAKRPHWTTEEVLEDILNDEEPAEGWEEDMGEVTVEDGRGEVDRDEPVMQGSDDEFSDWDEGKV